MPGMMMIRPGPLTRWKRPRKKTTPRSILTQDLDGRDEQREYEQHNHQGHRLSHYLSLISLHFQA